MPASPPSPRLARFALALYWPLLALATHWPNLKLEVRGQDLGRWQVDKLIHAAAFAALAVLLVLARPAGRSRRFPAQLAVGVGLAAAYCYLDELTQRHFERTPSSLDLLADLAGVLGAAAALVVARMAARRAAGAGPGGGPPGGVLMARMTLAMLAPFTLLMLFNRNLHLDINLPPWLLLGPHMGGIEPRFDWFLHFCFGLGITSLLVAAWPLGERRRGLAGVLVVAGMIGLGPGIEGAQYLVGRGFEWGDLICHEAGVFTWVSLAGAFALALRSSGRRRADELAAEAVLGAHGPRWPGSRAVGGGWTDEDSGAAAGVSVQPRDPDATSEPRMSRAAPITQPTTAGAVVPAADESQRPKRGFVGAAMTVGALTLLSRITGLLRDAYLASAFGLSGVSDAFWTGFLVPNLFRRLFGEGALTAAFIPAYTDQLRHDRDRARRLASLTLGLTLLVLGGLTLLGELALAGALRLVDWTPDRALAVKLTMVMLPYMPLVCLVAVIGAMLQVHGRFAPSAGMPIFLNVVMIAGTWFALRGGNDEGTLRFATYAVGVSVVIAGVVQLVAQGSMLLRYESFTAAFGDAWAPLRGMMRTFFPMVLALAVFQINTAMDTILALTLSPSAGGPPALHLFGFVLPYPISEGSVTALNNAQRLYQFPLGVFGLAIATAIFPALAHAAASDSPLSQGGVRGLPLPEREGKKDAAAEDGSTPGEFRRILQQGLRLTVFIGLPASVGLVLVGLPVTRVLFERRNFTLADSIEVARILAGYAPAIWAYSMTHVITRAFYALKDSRTPLVVSLMMVALNFLLNVTLVWWLGAAGLAWATAACAVVQNVMLLTVLRRRYVGNPVDAGVWLSWGRTALLTGVMAAVLAPVLWWYPPAHLSSRGVAVELAALLLLGGATVLGGAWLIRAEEIGWLRRRKGSSGAV